MILVAAGLLAFSGVPGLLLSRRSALGQIVATALACAAALGGLAAAIPALAAVEPIRYGASLMTAAGPGSGAAVHIDSISAVFLVPIFVMAGLGSIYGTRYWSQSDHAADGRKLRLFYGVLPASMALLVVAHDGIIFLFAWEVMALSAFFLVTTEDRDPIVQRAGWIYFATTHVATLCIFALFALLQHATGSFSLDPIPPQAVAGLGTLSCLFALCLVGFGLKAGLMPLHVWLPDAHAAAPSHVSAMLSGVVIKIGIYGLVRFCSLLPDPPLLWGAALLFLGTASAVGGVAFALAQHDLKRLLAYHSIENIGIIVMGLGVAMIGRSLHRPDLVALGVGGALLHVWNHFLFKALLFLGAGSVIHATCIRDVDRLGGLWRRMPVTALLFAIGSAAICGLPPFNGFVSELLVFLGLFSAIGGVTGPGHPGLQPAAALAAPALAAPALALVGGLAVACFIKAIGAVFLGQPRGVAAAAAKESPPALLAPMSVLAACCLLIGLAPMLIAPSLDAAAACWQRAWAPAADPLPPLAALASLGWISATGAGLLLLVALLTLLVVGRMRRGGVAAAVTWDCGYAAPAPRMQYTASSTAQILVRLFSFVLRPREHRPRLRAPFPHRSRFRSHVDDVVLDEWIVPGLRAIARRLARLRVLQQGRVQLYVLYVFLAMVLLLVGTLPLRDMALKLLGR